MKRNVRDGEVFIFVNRGLKIMKILHLEHGGLVIYYKKLERGVFNLPTFDAEKTSLALDWQQLVMIVSDVKINRRMLKKNLV